MDEASQEDIISMVNTIFEVNDFTKTEFSLEFQIKDFELKTKFEELARKLENMRYACKLEQMDDGKYIIIQKGHVVSIAVLDEHRKKGIGRILVEESVKGVKLQKCDEFYLEVRCSNNEAVRLYEKYGFVIRQQLNAYYRDGEDAYLMAIELD